jgi:hypothetical protein
MTSLSRFFLFLLLPLIAIAAPPQETPNLHFSKGPAPDWVQPCEFSIDPPAPKPSQVNTQDLLVDTQNHLDSHTFYWHRVVKVLSQTGIDQCGQFSIDFNPEFEKVTVHALRIYRDGYWSDRLESSHSKILQREEGLSDGVYDGSFTLIYFLSDIRVGDIIESSCSIEGESPLFSSHFSRIYPFQFGDSVEKISRRILANPSQTFHIKTSNTSLEPRITEISPTLKEWLWESLSTEPLVKEKNRPSWFDAVAKIQISQYNNWKEVADKRLVLYYQPDDYQKQLSPKMISLVKNWKDSTQDPTKRALLAVRFVQDEVRYQGFANGVDSHKPKDPNFVFENRFGDCKDKSFLLHVLLKLMDISSSPVVVNTKKGLKLPEMLPDCYAFNHIVLKISIDNKDYFVDSTIPLQGGSLAHNYFPNYHYGLLISEDSPGLIPLPKLILEKPTEIATTVLFTSPELAEVHIQKIFHGLKADNMRRMVQGQGIEKISEDQLKDLKIKYGNVSALLPLAISDDRQANVFIMTESYTLPTRERMGRKILKTHSFIMDYVLDAAVTLERKSPRSLGYPVWVKEHISIKNPFNNWPEESDELISDHESLRYHYTRHAKGENMDITYEIEHLKDHITVEGLQSYWNLMNEIEEETIKTINVTPKKPSKQ